MKQKHEFKSIVAETLLIPLYMRAKESRRERPILNDKAAECLADSLEYDYSRFDGAKLSEGRLCGAWMVFRPCRAAVHRDTCPSGGRERGLWAGYPLPAYRRRESRFLRYGLTGSHRVAP
mgnify:CR=1 FL=1